MHRRQKRGEERGIGRTPNRKAGEKQSIHGEERQVGDHAKRCGAGRELGGAAMADMFIVAFARRGGNEAGRKNNAQRRAEAKSDAARAARAARATLWVRPDTGTTEISLNGTSSEPLIRGTLFTRIRNSLMVMARYVTA